MDKCQSHSKHMSQQARDKLECKLCDSTDDLTFTVVTKDPIEDESYIANDPIILCEEHFTEVSEDTEYYVRELAPVPDERGGFQRTTDNEGNDILYDHDISQESWVRFDPEEDEIDLTKL